MTFLLAEDKALKDRLTGMTVSDGNTEQRTVGAWFGQPDRELRPQDYPYVVLNLVDMSEAPERMMSLNPISGQYYTPPTTVGEGETLYYSRPIPMNLDYQITTYARHPRHDRQLLRQLMRRVPPKGGLLNVPWESDPTNATVRRMDFLGLVKRDRVEDNKRLFINAITVRVSTETEPDAYYVAPVAPDTINLIGP